MKKSIIALCALALTAGVNAQSNDEKTGGMLVGGEGFTNLELMGTGAAAALIGVAIVNNNRSSSGGTGPVDPVDPVDPVEPTCEGDDELVDDVCVGTTNTVTVTTSGTGTATKTITVPVTFTYAPTVQ